MNIFVLILSLFLAVERFMGVKSLFFQGVAHLFVGFLFGLFLKDKTSNRWFYLLIFLALTAVEVVCAFILKT